MKPTKEAIELAKRLYELGYRQEIEVGEWVYSPHRKVNPLLIVSIDGKWLQINRMGSLRHYQCIPIPSLETTLDWLRERGSPLVEKPREASLRSMVKLIEEKNEQTNSRCGS